MTDSGTTKRRKKLVVEESVDEATTKRGKKITVEEATAVLPGDEITHPTTPALSVSDLGTVWAEGWMSEGWPPSAPDPRWAR